MQKVTYEFDNDGHTIVKREGEPKWVACPDVKSEGHIFDITIECGNPNTANLMTMGSCKIIRMNGCCPRGFP